MSTRIPEQAPAAPRYAGPCGLHEALAACDPVGHAIPEAFDRNVRLAVSVPNGDWIAVQTDGLMPRCRRVARISGRGGSQLGTGLWLSESECPCKTWRPA